MCHTCFMCFTFLFSAHTPLPWPLTLLSVLPVSVYTSILLFSCSLSHNYYPSFSPHLPHLSDPSISQEVTDSSLYFLLCSLVSPFYPFSSLFLSAYIVSLAVPLKFCFPVFLHPWFCLSLVSITGTYISHQNTVTQSL